MVDREAKKRGTAVYLTNRFVPMLPPRLSNEVSSLLPGKDKLTISVVFQVDRKSGAVDGEPWIGKGIIKSTGKISYHELDAVLSGKDVELQNTMVEDIKTLNVS